MHRLIVLAGVLVVLIRGGPIGTGAQDATPPAGFEVSAAEACRVTPRAADFYLALTGTPVAGLATPGTGPGLSAIPDGEPVDAKTVEGVTATMQEVVACFNAANLLRAFALFSDDYFRRLIQEEVVREAFTGFLAGAPAPVTRIGLQSVQDVRVLPDGRVGALVILVDPEAPTPEEADRRFVVFVKTGDRWLIDEVIELEARGTPTP